MELQNEICLQDNQQFIGRQVEVLIEGRSKSGRKQDPNEPMLQLTGRTMCDRIVVFDGSPRLIGQIMPIMIYDTTPFTLLGSVVTSCVGPEVYTLT